MFIFIVSLFMILASFTNAISHCVLDKRGKSKIRTAIDLVVFCTSLLYMFLIVFFCTYNKEDKISFVCASGIAMFILFANILNCVSNGFDEETVILSRFFAFLSLGISVIALTMYGIFGGKLVIDTESEVQDVQYITAINDAYVVLSQYGDNINVLYLVNDNGKEEYKNKVVKKEDISISENSDKPCITTSTYYYKKIRIFGNEKSLQEIAKEKVNINAEKEQIINSELLSE